MKKLNQKGMGTVEIILIIVIVGLLVGVGWYVWKSKQNTDKSLTNAGNNQYATAETSKKETPPDTEKPKDDTTTWLQYESPKKEYKIRIPDGWKLQRFQNDSNLYAFTMNSITFSKGIKASVTAEVGGRDFASIAFWLIYNADNITKRGSKVESFKTNEGVNVDKYYFVQKEKEPMMDIPYGAEEYLYFVGSGKQSISVRHDVLKDEHSQTKYIEQALKTIEL